MRLVNVCMSIIKIIKKLTNKHTAILAIVFVTAIGLTSDSTSFGGKTFGIGIILEIFHRSGTVPCYTVIGDKPFLWNKAKFDPA